MYNKIDLKNKLESIHRKSYPAYKSLRGSYTFGDFVLSIDHVQGDPFAAPSSLHVELPLKKAGFPEKYLEKRHTKTALEDLILRSFSKALDQYSFKAKGSGKSGLISTSRPGPEVMRRTAVEFNNIALLVRFEVGFPANGRTINAQELEKILLEFLPQIVKTCLFYQSWEKAKIQACYELTENKQRIREVLEERKLVAFCANGSILPRKSGVSSQPLKDAIEFQSPESMEISIDLPFGNSIRGMGIPEGVTLIIGGGYHGKSTLLQALEQGVYNHVKGDGREYVITRADALKLRAEDGRAVSHLDLSLFIHDLPNGKDTHCFSTEDASGSTSQAAGVLEGMEAETSCFLIDEDTSATNFLVRDAFMQRVVSGDQEPITPFIARVRDLYEKVGISTILVAGSSGAFFHVADTIIQMDAYRPKDVKMSVEALLPEYPPADLCSNAEPFTLPTEKRMFVMERKIKRYGRGEREERIKTKVMGTDGFSIEHNIVDLRCVEQLIDTEQTAALAAILKHIVKKGSICMEMQELVAEINTLLKKKGMAAFVEGALSCGYAYPRKEEIYLMLNRFRRG
ncbi:MAG: ABC-ATPase domain-containing protein [Eubacterium ramulus]|uniref:ABC-ATPase domain-containing protein n=1 Tax=Eubacterium ramulus TaxID=39490 RepID=UPI0039A34243